MYCCIWVSNDEVSVTLERKALEIVLISCRLHSSRTGDYAYKRPVTSVSVDMDDALNAEHCVEPDKDMQL